MTNERFCTHAAQQDGEQLYGTATANTTVWLALEYPFAWGAKAVPESALSLPVKDWLMATQVEIDGARVQLIKRESASGRTPELVARNPLGPIRFYISLSREGQSATYKFLLDRYEDLLEIDVAEIASGGLVPDAASVHTEPLFLICTNGKRDQCCSKFGLPVYQAMNNVAANNSGFSAESVWQTTHTGGHRFAATMVCLPEGVLFGWVEPSEAEVLMRAYQSHQLYQLNRYRGRSCYGPAVQAADYHLRQELQIAQIDGIELIHAEADDATADGHQRSSQWTVQLRNRTDGQIHHLSIESRPSSKPLFQSCLKEAKVVPQYFCTKHRVLA